MDTEPQDVLRQVFARVLEDYAFMFREDIPEEGASWVHGPYLQAGMCFSGPFQGRLVLMAPESFAREVAANVLGLDAGEELSAAHALDALKESLNVTCGNLLTALAGEEPVVDLTVPEVTAVMNDGWTVALASSDWSASLAGDWPVLLQLNLTGPCPSRCGEEE